MADISSVTLPDGKQYSFKDTAARTPMGGTTGITNGVSGQVPAPKTTDVNKFLKSDGTWAYAVDSSKLPLTGGHLTGDLTGQRITGTWLQTTADTHITSKQSKVCVLDANGWIYSRTISEFANDLNIPSANPMTGATAADDGVAGIVPQPLAGQQNKFLRGDGHWEQAVDRSKVPLSGGTMTGTLVVPTINNTSYLTTPLITNNGEDAEYHHRLVLGSDQRNQWDFYEKGGVFNFYRNTADTKDGAKLIASIQPDGIHADLIGKVNNHTISCDVPANAIFTDHIYTEFKGSTSAIDGVNGLVPKPTAGHEEAYLCANGTWVDFPCHFEIDDSGHLVVYYDVKFSQEEQEDMAITSAVNAAYEEVFGS